jgi:hypothetical protein
LTTLVRAVTIAAALLFSATMLALNIGFEIAGSVPDVDGCGFLAGSLLALLLLYPLVAAFISARATDVLIRRGVFDEARLLRCGGRIGGWGAGTYFLLGIYGVLATPHSPGVTFAGWALGAFYTCASFAGARAGALWAVLRGVPDGHRTAPESGS